jgi:hypothetical protein
VLDFKFELRRHGWATSRFAWEGGQTEFTTSYLTDPISDMAAQARWIIDPLYRQMIRWPSKALFSDEPGEMVVELVWREPVTEKETEDGVDLRDRVLTLSLAEWEDIAPDRPPNIVHTVLEITGIFYVELVFRELDSLWSKFGVVEYRRHWLDTDFPVAHYAAIGHCLKRPPPARPLW